MVERIVLTFIAIIGSIQILKEHLNLIYTSAIAYSLIPILIVSYTLSKEVYSLHEALYKKHKLLGFLAQWFSILLLSSLAAAAIKDHHAWIIILLFSLIYLIDESIFLEFLALLGIISFLIPGLEQTPFIVITEPTIIIFSIYVTLKTLLNWDVSYIMRTTKFLPILLVLGIIVGSITKGISYLTLIVSALIWLYTSAKIFYNNKIAFLAIISLAFFLSLLDTHTILVTTSIAIYVMLIIYFLFKSKLQKLVGLFLALIIGYVALRYNIIQQAFLPLVTYTLLGLIVYAILNIKDKAIVSFLHNAFFFLIALSEPLWKDPSYLYYIRDKRRVLEVGFGTGYITKHLNKNHEVDGSEISIIELFFAKLRFLFSKKKPYLFLDEKDRISINKKYDAIVGYGVIGYIKDIKTFARDIVNHLNENGKILFVDFSKEDLDRLSKELEKLGVKTQIEIKNKKLWREYILKGIKVL